MRFVWTTDRDDGVRASHLHPKDTGGALISMDEMVPPERWEWGGPGWETAVRTDVATGIVGAEIQSEDPAAMSRRWSEVLGLERVGEAGLWRLPLDGGELRFVAATDGRGEGLGAFDVAVRDIGAVTASAAARRLITDGEIVLAGTRVRLVSAS